MATAWNLLYQLEGGAATWARAKQPDVARPAHAPSGWAGSDGPGIEWRHWPRSEETGLPMQHALTLWLPQDYRRKGEHYPGIAFFVGAGESGGDRPQGAPGSEDPFLADLALAEDHPLLGRRRSLIDEEYALLWLTADQLAAGPTAAHPDTRRPGEHVDDSDGSNAWDASYPRRDVWLVPREDPNAGIAPGDEAYEEPPTDQSYRYTGWADGLANVAHLGGTVFPAQDVPEGLSPWYLELMDSGPMNFGGDGSAQIDLETDVFDWACG